MHFSAPLLIALAGLAHQALAVGVVGAAEGFAKGVTGGGDATPDYPSDIDELKSMLTDDTPRVIVLEKEYDFTASEGTTTGTVCASWGTGDSCQRIIQDDCGSSPSETATWYVAPTSPIDIASNKSIIGVGSKGVIKGKGLRVSGGSSNVIIQNIRVSDLNHEYVWGGDAISFDGADLVWVDHVETARPGRQHYCFGFETSTRITLSNNFVNGNSTYSTGCDGYHYWTFEMVGYDDQITMKNNYIYHTSGRGPALSGGTLLHAVNNVWSDINGHALEGGNASARGVYEGNAFINVETLVSDYQGMLFTSPDTTTNEECQSVFGRSCEVNVFESTTDSFDYSDTSFFSDFSGLEIASAEAASEIKSTVPENAGVGVIDNSSDVASSSSDSIIVSSTPTSTPVSVTPEAAISTTDTELSATTLSIVPQITSVFTPQSSATPTAQPASDFDSGSSTSGGRCGDRVHKRF